MSSAGSHRRHARRAGTSARAVESGAGPGDAGASVLGIGVDVASVSRVGAMVARHPDDVLAMVFTPGELRRARSAAHRRRHLTVCFAAKEAVGKALGCGLAGIDWTDAEATVGSTRLSVELRGAAALRAAALGARTASASWACLGGELVVAYVVLY